jgi:hypothetical protein
MPQAEKDVIQCSTGRPGLAALRRLRAVLAVLKLHDNHYDNPR